MSDDSKTSWERGLKVVDQVYGAGASGMMQGGEDSPFIFETVAHLFGDLWGDSTLSIRDKRLMVLGATAMLGNAELVEIQLIGAIVNGELTDAQLDEIPRFLLFYAGAGNTTALYKGIQAAKAKAKGRSKASG